jgi:hypothetical protein
VREKCKAKGPTRKPDVWATRHRWILKRRGRRRLKTFSLTCAVRVEGSAPGRFGRKEAHASLGGHTPEARAAVKGERSELRQRA